MYTGGLGGGAICVPANAHAGASRTGHSIVVALLKLSFAPFLPTSRSRDTVRT